MKKIYLKLLMVLIPVGLFGQVADLESLILEPTRKNPVTFTHQPFLLLKVTPSALFENDNVFMFGGEIAPPFGKVSFNIDYGIGSYKWSLNKFMRNNFEDSKSKIFRGEIRTYFSDWFPFYALDKKPFGRYYALEVSNKNINRTQSVAIGNGGLGFPSFVNYQKIPVQLTEQAVHFKFGKHFLINRFIFLDGFVGLGPGRYELIAPDTSLDTENIIHNNYSVNRKNWQIGTKGLFLSRTAGIRVCLAL